MTVEEVLIQGLCEFPYILPIAGEGYVSTGACHSVHGGVFTGGGPREGGIPSGQRPPLDRDPSGQRLSGQRPANGLLFVIKDQYLEK